MFRQMLSCNTFILKSPVVLWSSDHVLFVTKAVLQLFASPSFFIIILANGADYGEKSPRNTDLNL